jgi:anti-sigma factor RsiW
MDCNDARPLLSADIDRELSAAEALRVEQHLASCAACQREAQALRAVSQVTRGAAYFRAPDALRERILAVLPAVEAAPHEGTTVAAQESMGAPEPPAPNAPGDTRDTRDELRGRRASSWIWVKWLQPRNGHGGTGTGAHRGTGPRGTAGTVHRPSAVLGWPIGIAAAVALVVTVSLFVTRPANTNAVFVDELVASHVRAQLSGHDIDVVSSDQHTVKPWFNGRLDYAPPVEDLADEGFALTGGRLDYIGHRRVGVLVYRYRTHIVDVYVMPETDTGTRGAASLTSDGYALASWRAQGMRWWAISDAEPAVLAQLRTALTARLDRTPPGPPK